RRVLRGDEPFSADLFDAVRFAHRGLAALARANGELRRLVKRSDGRAMMGAQSWRVPSEARERIAEPLAPASCMRSLAAAARRSRRSRAVARSSRPGA